MRFEDSIPNCPGDQLRRSLADARRRLLPAFPRLPRFRSRAHGAVRTMVIAFTISVIIIGAVLAQDKKTGQQPSDLTNLSLDELMKVEVTSVSKHEQKLFEAPAAVHVITQEDIRRSGATCIPELLRMVPGLHVAKINANKWAIGSRGFSGEFSNKLLVLIDGRAVYTPLFAGVFWDVQDVMLEDIERIEVIRGPGASLWGSNAVNGVINIITKKARDTQGGLITLGTGSEEYGFGAVRYGGTIGSSSHYRVYAKYFNRASSLDESGLSAADQWQTLRGGFRLDWNLSKKDSITVQGDIYNGTIGQRLSRSLPEPPFAQEFEGDFPVKGGNVLARWNRAFSSASAMNLQFYYDRTTRDMGLIGETRDTFDLDFQHSFALGSRQAIVWGLNARSSRDAIVNSFSASINPAKHSTSLFSGFVQDEINVVRDKLRLTVGVKIEDTEYTGVEGKPTVRLVWTPSHRHAIWGAFSHADRTPSRAEQDVRLNIAVIPAPDGTLTYVSLFGDRASTSEELNAYEAGYRVQPINKLFLRIAAFRNLYRGNDVVTTGNPFVEADPPPVHVVIPIQVANGPKVNTHGVEAAADWSPIKQWKLAAGYSWLSLSQSFAFGGPIATALSVDSPKNQFFVRSLLNLRNNIECDATAYYVGKLPVTSVPRYLRVDLRVGWRPTEALEFSAAGQDLFDAKHAEFGGPLFGFGQYRTQVERRVYGKVTWRF